MSNRVVVTGLGTVSPLGNNLKDTWSACLKGKSGIQKISRFDASGYRSQIAGEIKNFPPLSFISKKEQKKMGRFSLYALAATQEALADAGLQISEELSYETGVSVGVGIGGLEYIEQYYDIVLQSGPQRVNPFFLPITLSNMAAGQISIVFGTKNYNGCVSSACASSNHSIGDAARIIERGDAKLMIAGGTESAISPMGVAGFAAMRALSTRNDTPSTASRPYDKDRDGFVLSEGAGILILEEMEFAKQRGAKMYCELTGYGFSSDAYHITSPSIEGPVRAMQMALEDAKIDKSQVNYVNAHATSTKIGDLNELKAIKKVFGKTNASKINISSTKSMTGHLLGAAAALEAVLTIKMMNHRYILPTTNITEIDPDCELEILVNQGREFPVQCAISNAFGFGGTNATLVFQAI